MLTEGEWRWAVTFAVFLVIAAWETIAPLRQPTVSTGRRWAGNFALLFATTWFMAWALPVSVVAAAIAAEDAAYGLLNRAWLPAWVVWPIAILHLDCIRFGQHWLLHRVPILWRLHQVHHADPDYDLTTGLRFHPLEALFTIATQCAVISLTAPPPMAVLVGELLFVAQVHIVHGNVSFPAAFDRRVRFLLVTPNIHAIHHSMAVRDQNTNFGGVFTLWDRLFRTFQTEPSGGWSAMRVGLEGFEGERGLHWSTLFLLPFQRTREADYPISSASRPAASSQPPPARGS